MVLLLLKDYYIYVAVFIFSTITENIIIGKKAQIHFPYIEAMVESRQKTKKLLFSTPKVLHFKKSVRHRVTHLTV